MITNIMSKWCRQAGVLFLLMLVLTVSVPTAFAADLSGTVKTADGTPLCALALASGQSMFTCSPVGVFSFTGLALEPDNTIKLQVYADGFYPTVTSLSAFGPQQIVMKPAEVCDGGEGTLTNKQKTERLIGQWRFVFTILTDTFGPVYSLSGPATLSTSGSGDYLVFGTDNAGNSDVAAQYSSETGTYIVVDQSNTTQGDILGFEFEFIGENFVTGDVFTNIGGVFTREASFNGTRLAAKIESSAAQQPNPPTETNFETRLREELEVRRMARASISARSEETDGNAKESIDTLESAVDQLLETLRAR